MNLQLNLSDYLSLSPVFVLLFGALLLLLLEAFRSDFLKRYAFSIALASCLFGLLFCFYRPISHNPLLTPWLKFDSISNFFNVLSVSIGIGVCMLSYKLFKQTERSQGEYYFLILTSLIGMIFIGQSADFLTLFLGLEILSISIYVLTGYMKKSEGSSESSIKYFLTGSIATAFFLYGIALLYGAIGNTSFSTLLMSYQAISETPEKALFLAGIALITFGLLFKAAIVPFHFWAPDVYAGSSTPVTALMATGIKLAAFAALCRIFMEALIHFDSYWNKTVAIFIYPTLFYSVLLACKQTNLRRFFAYSGISHAGFLMIPLVTQEKEAYQALITYLTIYTFATLGCFAVLCSLQKRNQPIMIDDLKGLFQREPLQASILSFCLVTLAGFPPTVGFFAKFYIFKSAFSFGYYELVFAGLLASIFSLYYTIRLIVTMLEKVDTSQEMEFNPSWPEMTLGIVCSTFLVAISCFPSLLI